jgi:hypothetical protein
LSFSFAQISFFFDIDQLSGFLGFPQENMNLLATTGAIVSYSLLQWSDKFYDFKGTLNQSFYQTEVYGRELMVNQPIVFLLLQAT